MDKQPVGQLPDLTQSNNDDEIMVITNSEYNQLKKEKISDFITDLQSTNTNNSLTTGSDGKLFVSKTINASDVDGVLSLDNIPQLSTNKLPETGISADNYSYPSSITVNDRGQVVSIVEGSAAEAGAYLDQSQITNCILEAPNGVATFSGSNITLKQGLKMLYPNGRNADGTLKNGELTLDYDVSIDLSPHSGQTFDFELMFGCNINESYLSQNYQESDVAPTNISGGNPIYLNTTENQMYFYIPSSSSWEKRTFIKSGKGKLENGVVTSFIPYQPVELAKNNDVVHNTGDEKIGGQKTFNQPIVSTANGIISTGNFIVKTANGGTTDAVIAINSDTGVRCGSLRFEYGSGYNDVSITAANESGDIQAIGITHANGSVYAYCPTYTNYADSSTKIVTTAYLANRWTTSKPTTSSTASKARPGVVIQNYRSGTTGAIKFSDGLIIQWGSYVPNTANENKNITITYPIAFSDNNYSLSFSRISTRGNGASFDNENMPNSTTKTGFVILSKANLGLVKGCWLAIGY